MVKLLLGSITSVAAAVLLSLASAGTATAADWSTDSAAVTCVRLVQDAQSSGSSDKNSLEDVADALSSPACRSVGSGQ